MVGRNELVLCEEEMCKAMECYIEHRLNGQFWKHPVPDVERVCQLRMVQENFV